MKARKILVIQVLVLDTNTNSIYRSGQWFGSPGKVTQLVEWQFEELQVAGSIPAFSTGQDEVQRDCPYKCLNLHKGLIIPSLKIINCLIT